MTRKYCALVLLILACGSGFARAQAITRQEFPSAFSKLCKDKYQAHVTAQEAGDTLWVYFPYTPGRWGAAESKEDGRKLYLNYQIASFNPYKVIEPPELKFVVQKVLREIADLFLRVSKPYKFFVLVVTDVTSLRNDSEQWYIGYFDDVKNFKVCRDFSGEGYARLVWSPEKVAMVTGAQGKAVPASYLDTEGAHVKCYDMGLREFAVKQIKWRVYKRFSVEYNKTPFDLTELEKRSEVILIVKKVFQAYNLNEFDEVFLSPSPGADEKKEYLGYSREQLEKYQTEGITRKPAF